VLKKAGIVVAVAAAGLLAVTPLAFADGGILNGAHGQVGFVNGQDDAVQVPIQACNNSGIEGVYSWASKDQSNSDSHDGDCHQKNERVDSSGSGH